MSLSENRLRGLSLLWIHFEARIYVHMSSMRHVIVYAVRHNRNFYLKCMFFIFGLMLFILRHKGTQTSSAIIVIKILRWRKVKINCLWDTSLSLSFFIFALRHEKFTNFSINKYEVIQFRRKKKKGISQVASSETKLG